VASGKRDRREGRDRRGRAQMDPGRGTEGRSLGTFALTVNVNVGQYRESLSAVAAPGLTRSQGTSSGAFARTQSFLSLHFSKLDREVSFRIFSKTVPKRRPLFLRHSHRPRSGD